MDMPTAPVDISIETGVIHLVDSADSGQTDRNLIPCRPCGR
jgi:hypothetical protein